MGVYVSEINMPKGEGSKLVLQIFPNGEVYDVHGIRLGIANWAEAVPVPEHGDLIDKHTLIDGILYELGASEAIGDKEEYAHWERVLTYVRKAQTIIPADKEGEG